MSMELRARKPYAGSEDEISINETTDSSLTAMETANKNQTLERFDEDNLTLGEDERPFYLVEPAYKVETFTPQQKLHIQSLIKQLNEAFTLTSKERRELALVIIVPATLFSVLSWPWIAYYCQTKFKARRERLARIIDNWNQREGLKLHLKGRILYEMLPHGIEGKHRKIILMNDRENEKIQQANTKLKRLRVSTGGANGIIIMESID